MDIEKINELTQLVVTAPEVFRRCFDKRIVEPAINDLRLDLVNYHILIMQYLSTEGAQPVNVVGEKMAISKSQMTLATDRLIRDGLITRSADDADRRKIIIDLSIRGRWVMDEFAKTLRNEISRIVASVSDEEADQLINGLLILNKISTQIK